jgi:hypothetical protein
MSTRRHVRLAFLTLVVVICVVLGVRGRGQSPTSTSGVVVSYFTLPAIDRGLVPDVSRSPDSPESKIRASISPLDAAR